MKQVFIVQEYTLTLSVYHDTVAGRLSFIDRDGMLQESELYSMTEINNIIASWKMNALCGSFGTGAMLAEDASVTYK